MTNPHIAVVILTKDEATNLPYCLRSLEGLSAEVFVIDCGSTDGTPELARSLGATVLSNPWTNYATQFNWALDNISSSAGWVLRLDADEALTPELRDELNRLAGAPASVAGGMVRLRIHFLGRWIRHGGMYPTWLLRVWRRGAGRCEDRWMDEHVSLDSGATVKIHADLVHENRKGLTHWIEKHNGYAIRECRDLSSRHPTSDRLHGQAKAKRRLKEGFYRRFPLFIRAWLYWAYRYLLRAGFLDGAEGFAYHFFQALWYRSLVDAKLLELRRSGEERLRPEGQASVSAPPSRT
ncbi:MAG: glycosyltransferase family 2 protein [Bryobacteraceae bacterium]